MADSSSTEATSSAGANRTTLYHNPNCSKSRGALELLQQLSAEQNLQLQVVEYLRSPPTRKELTSLLAMLPNAPAELVRNDKNFKALGLDAANYETPESVVDVLLEHPELMQRPVAVYRGRAAIGRPPENLQELYQ